MDNQEYIIINKTAIQKRIEDLKKIENELVTLNMPHSTTRGKIDELLYLLSQSTPLIPEIEKAFDVARQENLDYGDSPASFSVKKQDYISNLKLDI